MKKSSLRLLPGLAAAVVAAAASFGAATVVQAQTTGSAPPARPMPGSPGDGPGMRRGPDGPGMHGGPGLHGMRMMRELDRLKTSLQLNGSQAAAWDKAVAEMKPSGDPRAEMKAHHDRLATALDDPNFDPRKLSADMDRMETERRARMSMIREAWFSVYDTLNPVQRGQVREFLRKKMTHRPMMHGAMEGHHDGEHGRMPPPPPPPGGAPAR